ncbi:hypothetical protein [Neobacillus niacini]|uniref:hypothetical protein n=1 Tax=Neobacillus niacini TaxID=86668 RepID=UPI002856206F|nr:hypothetical protein [Neobacillus niacini]MDR7000198.1 hypothetical protein [Neobacillus niacini]
MKKLIGIAVITVVIFLMLHSTPKLALRTCVFFMGYPKAAFITDIGDDEYHNKFDKKKFAKINAKAYTLTKPPFDKATESELRNYFVRKIGYLYFAEYYGEL